MAGGALEGIRIVDMTSVLMGPLASQILGDLGADVIKVEPPAGDTSRYVGATRHHGMSAGFLHVNRNKRSVVLNLRHGEACDALARLIASADVFVTNVRPQALARLGFDADRLTAAHPRLVHCAVTGFSDDGPYAGRPAYDDLIQALCAVPDLTARAGDGEPRYLPVLMADRATGQAAANAILAALLHRERTGRGQSVRISMFETMVPFVLGDHMDDATFVPSRGDMGYGRLLSRSRAPFATRDGHIAVVIYTDAHWRRFFELCGDADRVNRDERLRDLATRTRHIDALYADLRSIFPARSTAEWQSALEQADIPCAPVHRLASLLEDPHLRATGYFREDEHATEGTIRTMAPSGTWSGSPPSVRRLAPRLGEHTRDVLREAGYDDGAIDGLIASGAAADADPR